jgi:type VI secretion system protein ImpI
MTELRLVLEHAPSSQATTEITFHGGLLTVGRGEEADWRIHDPESFVSRKHFVVSTEGDDIVLTDASSGGLFVDGASEALGPGNSVRVEDGMRVRFGDFVARLEMGSKQASEVPEANSASNSPFDFAFEPVEPSAPAPERPDSLPEPFGRRTSSFFDDDPVEEDKTPEPIDRDNPFALGSTSKWSEPETDSDRDFSAASYFPKTDVETEETKPEPVIDRKAEAMTRPVEQVDPVAVAPPVQDAELRKAFFKGLGLDPDKLSTDDPVAEMEALGKRFRIMADGVTHLLRTRAAEKQKVRIAQTIVGSSNVNPLKFAVSAEDAVSALVTERGSGYLGPDDSIDEAFRDLVDHQMRTWSALQSALRRMIDKFDPAVIEKELEDTGLLETLIAGGQSAKLWQLYQERYEEIARAAEERFLGEIGADFRDAYER